ncbi:MAG: sigma-70 family RNA polymerase sigma factor [Eubacteriales bacterium]|nr:sigma-70 family RNA polymerase sigma factor [Eubacteriales bacterium]MDD3881814.1 sigma-70 family RNA polymerase sigma factor [Eubacteriales bacterium]MDD4513689.1 sigma-70 family RNA polymerase sigma factor [Eubacteriales bacterium]
MKREQAEKITTEYLKPIYGFALKRCANLQDAEDLTQEIVLRVYRALLAKDDLDAPEKFIWTVAHNTLANYYRSKASTVIGVPIDVLAGILPSEDDTSAGIIEKETTDRLHREIAYLSKTQRRIVIAYYYENKKQEAIAAELGIPLGTVKWHLFEAKKELKRGMDTMRQASELKFNPIKFDLCGTNGSPGTKGANNNFFRNTLSQNIVYSVWKEDKTINQIADALGVSPVYVESEAEYLAEYGFLTESKGEYRCNILIDEATNTLVDLHDEMYQKAAKLFAGELFDALTDSGILKDGRIICGQTDKPISLTEALVADENFLLWALVPYIAALSGEHLMDKRITFEDAATYRPDGGHNICYASVISPDVKKPMYFDSMLHFCGPCWNGNKDFILWAIDSEWSAGRVNDTYIDKVDRILSLLSREANSVLSEDEYAFLAEMGMIKTNGEYKGLCKSAWQIVWLENTEIKNELIAIGDRIKERHWDELQALRTPYVKAVLDATPKHLHTMQKYGLQYIFFSDGWFILHCMKELVNSGKLKLPTEEQKKSLTTLIIPTK